MIKQIAVQYPHSITVIGKAVGEWPDLKHQTQNSFQIWLEKNLIDNSDTACGMSILNLPKEEWEKKAGSHSINTSHQDCMEILELLAGKVIEVYIGFAGQR